MQHHADTQYTIHIEHENRQETVLPRNVRNKRANDNKGNGQ